MDVLKNVVEFKKILSDLLSLDRLEKLAHRNQFIAMAYAEALMHVNYVILTWDRDVHFGGWLEGWTGQTKSFEPTFDAKLSAVGFAFAHSAGKLDNLLGTAAIKEITGMAEVAADVAKGVLSASKIAQQVGLPPGYAIEPKKGYKLVKK